MIACEQRCFRRYRDVIKRQIKSIHVYVDVGSQAYNRNSSTCKVPDTRGPKSSS